MQSKSKQNTRVLNIRKVRQCQLGTHTRQRQSQARAVTEGQYREELSHLAGGKTSILARLPEGEELSTLKRGQE